MRKGLLQLVFSGAHMQLWADKPRHFDMFEPERQALRLASAFTMYSLRGGRTDGRILAKMADAAVFEYLFRLVVTDIKPTILAAIRQDRAAWEGIVGFAMDKVRGKIDGGDRRMSAFADEMTAWLLDGPSGDHEVLAARFLDAGDCVAMNVEYGMVSSTGIPDFEREDILGDLGKRQAGHSCLDGFDEMFSGDRASPLAKLVTMFNALRFQIRWPQVSRVPATSVLSHVFMVSALYHLFARTIDIPLSRRGWSFFAGLFHDLPEAVTKDVISPLKNGVPGLRDRLSSIERAEMDRTILAPLDGLGGDIGQDLRYVFGEDGETQRFNEFRDRYRDTDGKTVFVDGFSGLRGLGGGRDAVDGSLLKACDLLSAYMEASESVSNGSNSWELVKAKVRISDTLGECRFETLDFKAVLSDFEGGRP